MRTSLPGAPVAAFRVTHFDTLVWNYIHSLTEILDVGIVRWPSRNSQVQYGRKWDYHSATVGPWFWVVV
jgi:hypothetical protein